MNKEVDTVQKLPAFLMNNKWEIKNDYSITYEAQLKSKGKYLNQKPLFPPLLFSKIRLFLHCFRQRKMAKIVEWIWSQLARSAEIFEYLVLKLAETYHKGQENREKISRIIQK